jgi:hypothetical protein
MKISYENPTHGQKITIEDVNDDMDIYEIKEVLRTLLLAMSYQPSSIDAMFNEISDEIDS